jgi:hypothetical protein
MDPEGYYARLGVAPDAEASAIAAAYRAKARILHPDVPGTGNAGAFILLHEAYEVLGDEFTRARYDRTARNIAGRQPAGEWVDPPPPPEMPELPNFLSDRRVRLGLWAGLIVLTVLSVSELAFHVASMLQAPPPPILAAVLPQTPADDATMVPVGAPTHYVLPTGGAAPLWRFDATTSRYMPATHLEPFTGVAVLDAPVRDGMLEIAVSNGHGFIDATRLAPGGAKAARLAFCGYNAGPPLEPGEVLSRHGSGDASLRIDNTRAEPVIVRLRDADGATAVSVQAMQGTTRIAGLPTGSYTAEYATGTLWSRACSRFIAGQRSWRLPNPIALTGETRLTLPEPNAVEIAPDLFSHD